MEETEEQKRDVQKGLEIRKSLRLIDGRMDLPPMANRLFSFAVSRLRGTQHGERTVEFDAKELAGLIGTTSGNFPKELRAAAKRLVGITVDLPDWDRGQGETGWTMVALVTKVKYKKGTSLVSVTFDEDITPHIINLHNYYTKLELRILMKFRGTYSSRFYEFARSREGDVDAEGEIKPWTTGLDELRAALGIKANEYPRFVDFQRRVLLPAERELAQHAGLLLTHEARRRERKAVALKFRLARLRPPEPPLPEPGSLSRNLAEKVSAAPEAPTTKPQIIPKSKPGRPDLLPPPLLKEYLQKSDPNEVVIEQPPETKALKRVQFCLSNLEVHQAAGTTDPEVLNMCVLELVAAEHELHELLTRDQYEQGPPEPEDDLRLAAQSFS